YKGSSIAVWLPGARLNSHRTFSCLDDVRQHMASPSKIERAVSREKRVVARLPVSGWGFHPQPNCSQLTLLFSAASHHPLTTPSV
ncbi:MAG TPA: hypothetical protein PKL16_11510, partial [Anaerolineae bacterium]|nr:hypothetical protein [Anaerolineae bacterium]